MRLLPLESSYRCWLNSRAALAFDSNLSERFIGLTHDESMFFAEMSRSSLAPLESRDVGELERFIHLHACHERALASNVMHSSIAKY